MSCVWGYTHDKKRETERNPDLCLQRMRIPVSKQRKGLSRRLMEKLPGRETDSVGVGSRLWGKRLDNQATAAGGGDGVGAAATFGGRFRPPGHHLLGHNWGVMLALDEESGKPLYLEFIAHEKVQDYVDAVRSIEGRNYAIRGIVIDGMKSLFGEFGDYKIQMCQYHMIQIVRRYLTLHPKLIAARELNALIGSITTKRGEDFEKEYREWKTKWNEMLDKRSTLKSGKKPFTHKRLRSAMHSVDFYLPYLFTFQQTGCEGMPNTNNKIEVTFTELKKNLNNHSGMSKENRKRFISGFFLALCEI